MRSKLSLFAVAVVSVSLLSGCATSVYQRHTSGKYDANSRTLDYSSADFEVLGPIDATAESSVLLGLVARGNEGYGLLLKAARQKYGQNVTTVMFIFSDYSYEGILYPLLGTIKTSYSGTAVTAKTISHAENVRVKP